VADEHLNNGKVLLGWALTAIKIPKAHLLIESTTVRLIII
jgi:hypothetical protein